MGAWLQILQIVGNSTLFYLLFDTQDSLGSVFIWNLELWEKFESSLLLCKGGKIQTSSLQTVIPNKVWGSEEHYNIFWKSPPWQLLIKYVEFCSWLLFSVLMIWRYLDAMIMKKTSHGLTESKLVKLQSYRNPWQDYEMHFEKISYKKTPIQFVFWHTVVCILVRTASFPRFWRTHP